MTEDKRQEMKEYKEKAIAYEHKIKGKRLSLDSGVMIASTEMQKLENYESPTNVLKGNIYWDVNNTKETTTQNSLKTDTSVSPETPKLQFIEKNHKLNNSSSLIESKNIKSENINQLEKFCNIPVPKQKSINLTNSNLSSNDENNLNDNSPNTESISIKCTNTNSTESYCDALNSKLDPPNLLTVTNELNHDVDNIKPDKIPRLRSNSYTLSSPSPIMVAFLNSQVTQQLIEPKSLEKNINFSTQSKSEPPSINMVIECDDNILKTKSVSVHSIPGSFHHQEIIDNFVKYKEASSRQVENKIMSDESQDERGSVTTIGTNFSNEESMVGSVVTVFNGNSYENHSSLSSITSKSLKHCCCRHSDDDYSLNSNNINFKTPEELNLEAEQLRLEKLDIEKRHQEELSNLIKKQREEQEHIAVKYYLISKSTSSMSMDDSLCSESLSKSLKICSPLLQSEPITINNKSVISDTSSITSNCSINKNLSCSSPRQSTPTRSPHLHQNIKFYRRIRGGLSAKWTKAPTEIENSAATVINAGVRGYLTRRLLRTEKAQLLKKTILDSLKTALVMHMELKKQQPTESDLELHRRIINQVFIEFKHFSYIIN